MGRVTVPAVIESLEDVYRVYRGELTADQVRRIHVADALVDCGATGLSLPGALIQQLGLLPIKSWRAITATGVRDVQTFGAVKLTIQGRDCVCDVAEVDEACTVFIGQVPLVLMDFVIDPSGRALTGNPAHGGEHVTELL